MAGILVADDDPAVGLLLRKVLEPHGHSIWTAHEAGRAVERFLTHRPDLLIANFHLPGQSGAIVAHACWISRPDLPVLFVSARPLSTKILLGQRRRAGFLAKPFEADDVVREVDGLLAGAGELAAQ